MILFLAIILVVLVGFYAAQQIMADTGYVLVAMGNSAFELSFLKALIFLVLLFLALYFLIQMLRTFLTARGGFWRWRKRGQRKSSQQTLAKGLQEFFAGDWQKASKLLVAGAKKSYIPDVHYLIAAQAHQKAGDIEGVENLLAKVDEAGGEGKLAVELCKAQLLIDKGSYKTAAQQLEGLLKKYPKHTEVSRLLIDAYLAHDNWAGIEALLPKLSKQKGILADELSYYQEQITLNKLRSASNEGQSSLVSVWKTLPKKSKDSDRLKAFYVKKLIDFSAFDEAETEVRTALKSKWSSELLGLYGKINSSKPQAQLKQVTTWLKNEQEDACLFLTAGRVAMMNELWGKARLYFEKSLDIVPTPEVYAELGKLSAQLDNQEKSAEYFQKGLEKSLES